MTKKFRFKTIGITSGQGMILMRVYQEGGVGKWIDFDRKTGTRKAQSKEARNLVELKRQKTIETKQLNKVFKIKLTEKGVIECLKMELILTDILPDDLFCMVVFDIPESKKHLRDALRLFLKNNCFIRLQKSVWICQFNMVTILEKLFSIWKIKSWAKVYIVYEDSEKALRNYYK